MKNLIENEFKITSILVKGYYANYLTASLVEQFKNKQVLIWQDKNLYHSCKRIQLCFGVDLIFLLEDMVDEFDVLIIDKFRDNINPQETSNFIKTISQMEKMKNKQFIFMFSTISENKDVQICDYKNLKDVILNYSDHIYSFYRVDKCDIIGNTYQLQNIETEETFLLKEKAIGSRTILEEVNE